MCVCVCVCGGKGRGAEAMGEGIMTTDFSSLSSLVLSRIVWVELGRTWYSIRGGVCCLLLLPHQYC